ncbi:MULTISPECIES: hypothetical protein [unclassified Lysinibacillus]|uniref:hypothetical protein n=1 Tax=unclassified Lysinibacillus TaxID=2636778 RepID=UPI00088538C8|nr:MULTISPECIES: hypothetical protein [unclassified Lysinibacillus]SCY99271.1 hypothetical protein SAMN02787078_03465 [Lysinibacillus sp. SG9]SDB46952.1 hypothetical protein SAMN02787079_03598 [Lysinibacillus sp. TC-37]SFT12580.1 hypothetical protein SAMN02787087_03767 [Lysinibacillus sp. SG55]
MSYYDEDFYHEPSEFEMQIEQFKSSLLDSVKDEYKQQMENLQKENAELQEVKENFEAIKRDFANKERQLQIERNDLERKVRRERLSELTKDLQVIMYKVNSKRVENPKCEKCDANRRIHYKTPSGKDAYEKCECDFGERVYEPKEYMRIEFNICDGMRAWYEINDFGSRDEYARFDSNSQYAKSVYKEGMDFNTIELYSTFFKTKEECQAYCDYLNEQEGQ